MRHIQLAIDGPAGSGKSTIAKILAKRLGITYLDSGAMYRIVTLEVLERKIDFESRPAIEALLDELVIEFDKDKIYANSKDVTLQIREPRINENVSKIAAMGFIRIDMVKRQQDIAGELSIVMEGRDIGTKVLPNATDKVFLTASIHERAVRRHKESLEKGFTMTLEEIEADIARRDKIDSEREESPLIQADDAVLVDTTGKSIDEVVEEILQLVKGK